MNKSIKPQETEPNKIVIDIFDKLLVELESLVPKNIDQEEEDRRWSSKKLPQDQYNHMV